MAVLKVIISSGTCGRLARPNSVGWQSVVSCSLDPKILLRRAKFLLGRSSESLIIYFVGFFCERSFFGLLPGVPSTMPNKCAGCCFPCRVRSGVRLVFAFVVLAACPSFIHAVFSRNADSNKIISLGRLEQNHFLFEKCFPAHRIQSQYVGMIPTYWDCIRCGARPICGAVEIAER